ncbi:hypothetical protein V1281_002861 [Nitrobacteraceae bacterium AZCC 2161]
MLPCFANANPPAEYQIAGKTPARTRNRHCEEPLRRSNPVFACSLLDCFAKPVIGRRFAPNPLARNDGEGPAPYVPAFTCRTASAINSSILARIAGSAIATPLAARSVVTLRTTLPASSKSAATTSLA